MVILTTPSQSIDNEGNFGREIAALLEYNKNIIWRYGEDTLFFKYIIQYNME
jgi:hypothetical protein